MGRNLLADNLTCENIDEAKFSKKVDPIDTLRRIGKSWLATRTKCKCGTNAACDICEIDYLLEEAFEVQEDYSVQ